MTATRRPGTTAVAVRRSLVESLSGRSLSVTLAVAVCVTGVIGSPGYASGDGDPAEQVAQAVERARSLRASARVTAASLSETLDAVERASADSMIALGAYRVASEARREALVDLNQRHVALASAEAEVTRRRGEAARWVRAVYVDGGTWGSSPVAYTLLTSDRPEDIADRIAWLERSSAGRAEVIARLRSVAAKRQQALVAAERAAAAAESAARGAEKARMDREVVLQSQRQRLADLRVALETSRKAASAAQTAAERLAVAHLQAASVSSGLSLDGSGNRLTGPVGACRGEDVSAFGNGRIPVSALCPLKGAAGEALRADAAYAFNLMTTAYAARFGTPLCVNDSYRTYEEQVKVRERSPTMSAVPGRSKHGWGTAVDLCGGIERYSSAQHLWMRGNAPLFGWFHPQWARAGGSMPEPWHWEFSG
jgi:hypothetical protein